MRYPTKDKFWGWRMDPFEVYAYWDSWRTSPNLTLTLIHAVAPSPLSGPYYVTQTMLGVFCRYFAR